MKTIITTRHKGKTFELIKHCHDTDFVIVCGDKNRVKNIMKIAKEHGFNIKEPISYYQLNNNSQKGKDISGYYIDNIKHYLYHMNHKIKGFSLNIDSNTQINLDLNMLL